MHKSFRPNFTKNLAIIASRGDLENSNDSEDQSIPKIPKV